MPGGSGARRRRGPAPTMLIEPAHDVEHLGQVVAGMDRDAVWLVWHAHQDRLHAEQCFGKEHVAKQINLRQHKCARAEAEPVHHATATVETEHARRNTCTEESAIPREAVEQALHGLVSMGFAKRDVDRTLGAILARHAGPSLRPVGDLLREGIVALTR